MSEVLIQESTLSAIGNAIRSKTGDSNLMSPAEMVTAINGIEAGGNGSDSESIINYVTKGSYVTFGGTNSNVNGANAFEFTLDPNFVFGIITLQCRMTVQSYNSSTANPTFYNNSYLLRPKNSEDITSRTDIFKYGSIRNMHYDDDPVINQIILSLSAETVEQVKLEGVGGKTFRFSIGRYNGDNSNGTAYTYRFDKTRTNNVVLWQFCKPE